MRVMAIVKATKESEAELKPRDEKLLRAAVFYWTRRVAPRDGFEPATHGLTVRCSAS